MLQKAAEQGLQASNASFVKSCLQTFWKSRISVACNCAVRVLQNIEKSQNLKKREKNEKNMRKRPKNGTCGNFPETCGNFPETCGNFPKRAGICPKRAGICPKRAGICPKRAGIFGTGRKIGFFGFLRNQGKFWCERFLGEMTKTVAVFMTEIR